MYLRCFNKKWVLVAIITFILLVPAAITWAGCGTQAKTSFTYADISDPHSLDPALVDETVGVNIVTYVFEGLVKFDSKSAEVKPAMAESWDINDDATVFTFHLKHGVKFSNGREVKAQDFIYGWTRALDPATMSSTSSVLAPVKGASDLNNGKTKTLAGVEAPDDYTLKVTLEGPFADFLTSLTHPVCSPIPKEEVERTDVKYAEKPVGNGPFTVREWKHNEDIILDANSQYSGTKPKIDEVTLKIIPSQGTQLQELKAGNVDAVIGVDPAQMESVRNDSSLKLFEGSGAAIKLAGFNLDKDPWGNDKLRQALNYAVDRQTIADKVTQGQGEPADGIVPARVFGHQSGAMPYTFDVAKAKSLLDEAGYPGGKGLPEITLSYPTVPQAADAAQAIQSEFKDVGVNIKIQGIEPNDFRSQMVAGNLQFFLVAWQGDTPSIDNFLYPLFDTDNIGATDVFDYKNPEVDKLISKARGTTDNGARIDTYNEAERKILADAPIIPVVFAKDIVAYSPRVSNFVYTPLDQLALDEISVSS